MFSNFLLSKRVFVSSSQAAAARGFDDIKNTNYFFSILWVQKQQRYMKNLLCFFVPGDIVMSLFFVFFFKISFQEKLNKMTQVTSINIFLLLTTQYAN